MQAGRHLNINKDPSLPQITIDGKCTIGQGCVHADKLLFKTEFTIVGLSVKIGRHIHNRIIYNLNCTHFTK